MRIPLSRSVIMSMMVVRILTYVAPVVMLISIALGYTYVYGCTPTSDTYSFSSSFYITCSSKDHYSTPLSLSDSSMYTRSIGVALLLAHLNSNLFYTFAKTPLQVFLIYIYLELLNAQIAFLHGIVFLPHTLNMIMNTTVTSLPMAKCLALQQSLFVSSLLLFLFFSTFLLPPLVSICAHFSMLHYPLLLSIIFQLCSSHSCFHEL